MTPFVAVILAAGYGKRLKSVTPKVLNRVGDTPMIHLVVNTALNAGAVKVLVVVGHKSADVVASLEDMPVEYVLQEPPLGTGDAMRVTRPFLENEELPIVVLCGDVPLITAKTVIQLVCQHKLSNAVATVLMAEVSDPTGYGRIVSINDEFQEIVEDSDCDSVQKMNHLVNAGTYCFQGGLDFWIILMGLQSNNQSGEYYLTDVLGTLKTQGHKVSMFRTPNSFEIQSVNRPEDLKLVNEFFYKNSFRLQ